jgi:hypothetical protein
MLGFDLLGHAPTSKTGLLFMITIGGWRPLVRMLRQRARSRSSRESTWHTNDGDGPEKDGA